MNKNYLTLLAAAAALTVTLPALAKDRSEAELLADLASPKDKVVYAALQDLEKQYPGSTLTQPKVRALLNDPRPIVHEKAARVLGALHADLTDAELQSIAKMLSASDKKEIMEGLKALRGLKCQSVVPQIVALLKHEDANVKRDACRTLAVVGSKANVPDIEPLLQSPEKSVVKDASDAIFTLKNK